MTERYNGWTNYETWNVKLWMDNDQGSYEFWNEQAQECWNETDADEPNDTREADARIALAERLEQYFDDEAEQWMGNEASCFADLFNRALARVDWHEIAQALLDEVEREAETSEE